MNSATKAESPGEGPCDPAGLLMQYQLIPLVLFTWLLGKKLRPFLAELFGLSPSLLRRGRNLNLRKKREREAIASANQWFHTAVTKNNWPKEKIAPYQQSVPSILAGAWRPYADFIHGMETPDGLPLPLTVAFAEEIDLVLTRMAAANQNNDLESFKQVLVKVNWDSIFPRSGADRHEVDRRMNTLCASQNWDAALNSSIAFVGDLLGSLVAALDAEYCSTYFCQFQPRPLFLLVTPKMNPKFDPNAWEQNLPRRNFVRLPVRRLLELSHAMMVRAKKQRWPDKPVGRKELGEALGHGDQEIGNLFDGTRNLNARLFATLWERLCQTVARREPFYFPWPLLLAAICCQNLLINQHPNRKLIGGLLRDHANYTRIWNWHRQRWASQLSQGTEGWPAWLDS